MFGVWLLAPAITHAASYSFPASFSDGTQTTINLPIDTIYTIAALDLGGDGTSELLLGSPAGVSPKVRIIRQDGSEIVSWFPYGETFMGGIAALVTDENNDGRLEIVTAPIGAGGPHIRVFDTFGRPLNPGRFDENEVAALAAAIPTGTEIALTVTRQGAAWHMTLPRVAKAIDRAGKAIIIDLSDQRLSYYQDGFRIATTPASTGKPSTPTPIGEYAINNKSPRAWSRPAQLWMPYWMSFIGGTYGIHELPEWPGGIKEGADHLGTPVSGGCVRLGVGPAQTLYEWAEIGTPVIVQK